LMAAEYARAIYARRAGVTLTASIVGRQIGVAPKPGNGRESTNTGSRTYRAKTISEVPVKWASKTATRGTARPFIASANGGGAATVNMITPCTIGDGLTIARIVLVDGRYCLRSPIASPHQSWASLDAAKRGAETIALWALPNRKRDKIEIAKRPVADWYDRLDGSSDYYNEEGRHLARLAPGSWQDRDAAKAAALGLSA